MVPPGGELVVSTAPAQDGVGAAAVDGDEVVALDAAAARARVDSPVVRGGVFVRTAANVHPARLAFGLRERLLGRGARVHEGTRVRALRAAPGGVVVETAAAGACARGRRSSPSTPPAARCAPLRDRLTVSSSHIVCTEPVPDVVEALGWTGGESVTDGRALLHYTRTTRDGRIVFGWAGGRMAAGARTGGRMEVDHEVAAQARRDLAPLLPAARGPARSPMPGAARSTSPPPTCRSWRACPGCRRGRRSATRATASGPSHLLGRTLAALALDRRDAVTRLPFVDAPLRRVPPEPFRVAGAAVIRRALVAQGGRRGGGRPGRSGVARAWRALPALMGLHIVR